MSGMTTWTATAIDRHPPERLAGERAALDELLDWQRATLLGKCSGLDAEQLVTAAVPPSNLTLLGLVRHLTEVERWWFRRHVAGEDLPDVYCTQDWMEADFEDLHADRAEAELAAYEAEVEAARHAAAGRPLDARRAQPWPPPGADAQRPLDLPAHDRRVRPPQRARRPAARGDRRVHRRLGQRASAHSGAVWARVGAPGRVPRVSEPAGLDSAGTDERADQGAEQRPVLLTVDDDPAVSRAVARDLRRQYGERFRVVRAASGAEALDALREVKLRGGRVAVLLADYRMPEMSGIEFLEAAMDLFPRARRALLTAYADTDAAIAAINVVDVDFYLLKPWEPPEEKLYPVVDAMIDAYESAPDQEVGETKVVGHRWSAPSFEARDFLARNAVPYRWYASDEPEGERLLAAAGCRRRAAAGRRHAGRDGPGRAHDGGPRRRGGAVDGPGHGLLRRRRRRAAARPGWAPPSTPRRRG